MKNFSIVSGLFILVVPCVLFIKFLYFDTYKVEKIGEVNIPQLPATQKSNQVVVKESTPHPPKKEVRQSQEFAEQIEFVTPYPQPSSAPEEDNIKELQQNLVEKMAGKIRVDVYGRYVVESEFSTIVSNNPIFYPSPEQIYSGVEGCGIHSYYIEPMAEVSTVTKNQPAKTFHFRCDFDTTLNEYLLVSQESSSVQDSLNHLAQESTNLEFE